MALVDTGLVVRYYIDEAASGTTPTEVLDESGVGSDFDLTINYDGAMTYDEVSGNRCLDCTDKDSDAYARKIINDSSDKVRDNLDGVTKVTMEVVADVDEFSSSTGRLFVINTADSSPALGITGVGTDFYFYWNEVVVRSWSGTLTRCVFHIVVDTTLATANDRIIIYENGSAITPDYDSNPDQNDTLDVKSSSYLYMFNRGGAAGPWARATDGKLFYAALHGGTAFSQANVTNNYNILTSDDDTPSAGEWTTHTHSTIVFS